MTESVDERIEKARQAFQSDLVEGFLTGALFDNNKYIKASMGWHGLNEHEALLRAGQLDFKYMYEKDWGDDDDE